MANYKRKGKAGSVAPLVVLLLVATAGAGFGVWLIAGGKDQPEQHDREPEIALQTEAETGMLTTTTEAVSTATLTSSASAASTSAGSSSTSTSAAALTSSTASLPASGSVTSITLSFYRTTLKVGDEPVMPWVTMLPESAKDKKEIWKSSDEKVAKVDNIGRITPVGAGTCTVTVTSANNPSVHAEVSVTVTAATSATSASTTSASTTGTTGTSAQAASSSTTTSTTAANGARSDIEVIDGITYVQGLMIVNKTYSLPASYNPGGILPEAQAAFDKMQADAHAAGLDYFEIVSGFRSYDFQKQLYTNYCNRDGQAEADRFSARAGHSEHQTGLAMDINCAGPAFDDTPQAKWIAENCWKYGFIIRYPAGKEDKTGYKYESWHVRYVGEDWAKKITESGLTMEEYFNLDSKYAD